ncbi:hypothetical protein ES708_17216 [subsurface metagenome]
MSYKDQDVEKEMIPFRKIPIKCNYHRERLLDNIETLLKMKKEENLHKSKQIEFIDRLKKIVEGFKEDIINNRMTDNQYLSLLVLAKCMIKEMAR